MENSVLPMTKTKGKKFFGEPCWLLWHIFAINMLDSKAMGLFLWCYSVLLPCEECKTNFVYKLKKYPPGRYLGNADSAFYYSFFIHDLVNKHISETTGTKKTSPRYDICFEMYKKASLQTTLTAMWKTLYIFATTFRPENASAFITFLHCCGKLIPCESFRTVFNQAVKEHQPNAYMTNCYDAFFYVYLLQNIISKSVVESAPCAIYSDMRCEYFTALTQGCKDCGKK